ncbi:MAG: CehA/McbA family metallohydrolase, partial [Verrucomicrobiales bacterium]
VLNHRSVLREGVPPWGAVARGAVRDGALLDMDKLDWPFSMSLPVSTGAKLYELANNHLWRTDFAFVDWNTPAPGFLKPPYGGQHGGEREWLMYTLGMYYVLLDAGFRLVPTAGTANGVHPVPAGFGRVYVKLEGEFSYAAWLEGLRAGRSFVTTGPMLTVAANGQQAGATFRSGADPVTVDLRGEVRSEGPLSMIEVVVNGVPVRSISPNNRKTGTGALLTEISTRLEIAESGWFSVRCFEEREGGRVRFAHTAPWWVEVGSKPLRLRAEEKAYLLGRMESEIARSRGIVPAGGMAEYEEALAHYRALETQPADLGEARTPSDEVERKRWLENMVGWHGFSPFEVQAATGIGLPSVGSELENHGIVAGSRPGGGDGITVLPYPGGRHPRMGFLDGALAPQRETKLSVFAPWDESGYVVVDLPEALWSNLGLTYLGHTHIPTIWDQQGDALPRQEWRREAGGAFSAERELPNGIVFGARAAPSGQDLQMELWVENGSAHQLSDLRAQVCAMLKGLPGFNAQTGTNKLLRGNVAAVHDRSGKRWVLLAWAPCHRAWQNPPVPCLHSDPKFPDCAPGERVAAKGILRFYEGADIEAELSRLLASDWLKEP